LLVVVRYTCSGKNAAVERAEIDEIKFGRIQSKAVASHTHSKMWRS